MTNDPGENRRKAPPGPGPRVPTGWCTEEPEKSRGTAPSHRKSVRDPDYSAENTRKSPPRTFDGEVTVSAPAKINLTLDVTGLGEGGYHTIDSAMQTVSLYETVTVKKSRSLTLSSNARYIPTDRGNLAYRAAEEFFLFTGIKSGAEIRIKKKIPIKAGLAGGSADAAGAIVGLDRLYRTGLSKEELCRIGRKVSSDVPFIIQGGTKRATGRGEILSPCPALPPCRIVLAMPLLGSSTPRAYKGYDELGLTLPPRTPGLLSALEKGDLPLCCRNMKNDLEAATGKEIVRQTRALKKTLSENGALAALMTGSGAAVFGIFDDPAKAKTAGRRVRRLCRSVFYVRPVPSGAAVKKEVRGNP